MPKLKSLSAKRKQRRSQKAKKRVELKLCSYTQEARSQNSCKALTSTNNDTLPIAMPNQFVTQPVRENSTPPPEVTESGTVNSYAYASMAINTNVEICDARQLPMKEQSKVLEALVAEKAQQAFVYKQEVKIKKKK